MYRCMPPPFFQYQRMNPGLRYLAICQPFFILRHRLNCQTGLEFEILLFQSPRVLGLHHHTWSQIFLIIINLWMWSPLIESVTTVLLNCDVQQDRYIKCSFFNAVFKISYIQIDFQLFLTLLNFFFFISAYYTD